MKTSRFFVHTKRAADATFKRKEWETWEDGGWQWHAGMPEGMGPATAHWVTPNLFHPSRGICQQAATANSLATEGKGILARGEFPRGQRWLLLQNPWRWHHLPSSFAESIAESIFEPCQVHVTKILPQGWCFLLCGWKLNGPFSTAQWLALRQARNGSAVA